MGEFVGRPGGDEFTLAVSGLRDGWVAERIARRLRETLSEPLEIAGRKVSLTASIGIAVCPEGGMDADELLQQADLAMSRAKEHGRNNHQFFDVWMNEEAIHNLEIESGLRQALAQDESVVFYQPRVDLRSGSVTGVEALMRWRRPTGFLRAEDFIHVGEDCGSSYRSASGCCAEPAWRRVSGSSAAESPRPSR